MKNILLLSSDSKLSNSLYSYIKNYSFFNLVYKNNIKNIDIGEYELLIIDYYMDDCDGFDIIKHYNNKIKIIVIVPSITPLFIDLIKKYNVSYLLSKKFLFCNLIAKLELIFHCDNSLYSEIISLFNNIGLSYKLCGTYYIHDIIALIINENMEINMYLYVYLSKKYHKSVKAIERCIRYAICVSLKRISVDTSNMIFGYIYNYDSGLISNFDYINCLVNYLKYKKKDYH